MEKFLFIVFLFITGFSVLVLAFYLRYKSKKTNSWSSTVGIVKSSGIECSGYIGDDGNRSFKSKVVYQYFIEEKDYISKRIFYGDILGRPFSKNAIRVSNKYKIGDEVIVYFNPLCPKESVLEKGTKSIVKELFIIGCLFFLLGVVTLKYNLFF
jgi:hypothetical protein